MGQHGVLRQPGSVRDLKENGDQTQHDSPERPVSTRKLRAKVQITFDRIADEMMAAGVPTKPGDGPMVAMAAQCEEDYWGAKNELDRARIGRDLEKFYAQLGLHPASRLRLGIKSKIKGVSKTAQLLAMVAKPPQ